MSKAGETFSAIAVLIIGAAIVSVLVSQNAQTSNVIQAIASGFGNILSVAVSPVSGAQSGGISLGYPSTSAIPFPQIGGLPAF